MVSLLFSSQCGFAVDTNSANYEFGNLFAKVQTKLKEGKKMEKDFEPELKEFDALLAKHKNEKTDDVANILYMKAGLYLEVLHDTDKGIELLKQLKREFSETKPAQQAAGTLDKLSLVVGAQFPDFNEKDLNGKPISVSGLKGKVVLVDFWATWCPPCRAELPNVIKTYEKHHGKGFEIIGISLDQDKSKLTSFTKDRDMTWQQYFDGQGWGNKLAQKYGVNSIPATYLLDTSGKIIGSNLRGEDLEAAVSKALAKN